MIQAEIAVALGVLGAAMGSFAGAVAWRLHTKRNMVTDRSECEHCHHKLGVADLIPVISWLMLRGRCRYCGVAIGWYALLTETALAVLFVVSYVYWPLGFAAWQAIALFVLWLCYLTAFAVLVLYDLRHMVLPDTLVLPLVGVAFADAALRVSLLPGAGVVDYMLYAGYGMLALAGVYGALYVFSRGRWVGFGDVKLAVFIGVTLGWQKALLVFLLANVVGFLVLMPGLASGKLTRTSRVPFGPFLLVAFIIAGLWGDWLIRAYISYVGL